jgi:hypothetical protein
MTELALILDEGRVYGSRYYTVEPKIRWDIDKDWGTYEAYIMMEKWCTEIYGPTTNDGVWTPGARWYANNEKFWFREQKDMEWFILKWG